MKQLRYILFLLFFFLGLFSRELKAEIVSINKNKVGSYSDQDSEILDVLKSTELGEEARKTLLNTMEKAVLSSDELASYLTMASKNKDLIKKELFDEFGEVSKWGDEALGNWNKLSKYSDLRNNKAFLDKLKGMDAPTFKKLELDLPDEKLRKAFSEKPELVGSWKVLENNPILRKKPENLENISKWLDEGIESQKLTDGIAKSKSKQNLINELGAAKSKLHARVLIKDYDNIPGVAKGRYVRNGSKLSDKTSLPSGWKNDVDLPTSQIENFTGKIEPLELRPGDKIFRVSSANGGSGAYWTRVKPEKLDDIVGGTAVQPQWNNFQYLYEYTVPDGITLKTWKGKTASQPVALKENGLPLPSNYHLPGGDEQIFINYIGKQDPNFQLTVKSAKAEW